MKYTQAFQEFDGINRDVDKFRVLTHSMLDKDPDKHSSEFLKRGLPETDSMESILAFVETQLVIHGFDTNELNMMQNILESFIPVHGDIKQIRNNGNEIIT